MNELKCMVFTGLLLLRTTSNFICNYIRHRTKRLDIKVNKTVPQQSKRKARIWTNVATK